MSFVKSFRLGIAALTAATLIACGGGGGSGIKFSEPIDKETPAFMSTSISIESISRIPANSPPTQTLAVVNVIEALENYSIKTRFEVAIDGLYYDKDNTQLNDLVKSKIGTANKLTQGIYKNSYAGGMSQYSGLTEINPIISIYDIGDGVSKLERYSGFEPYQRIFSSTSDPILVSLIDDSAKNLQPQLMINYVGFDVLYHSVSVSLGFSPSVPRYLVELCLWKNYASSIKRCDFIRLAYSGTAPSRESSDFIPFIQLKLNSLGLTN